MPSKEALRGSSAFVPNTVRSRINVSLPLTMSMFDKFRKGAQKAGMQATAFVQSSTTKVASGSREFVQTFSLPGEAEKAANILDSFLGSFLTCKIHPLRSLLTLAAQRILTDLSQHSTPSQRQFCNGLEVSILTNSCSLCSDYVSET